LKGRTYGEHPDGVDGELIYFSVGHDEWMSFCGIDGEKFEGRDGRGKMGDLEGLIDRGPVWSSW